MKRNITPSKSADNRRLFRKAADILRRGKWMRNDWFRGDKAGDNMLGTYCLTGAILKADAVEKGQEKPLTDTPGGYTNTDWYRELTEVLDKEPEDWNDANAKSKKEVIEVLEKLAGDK